MQNYLSTCVRNKTTLPRLRFVWSSFRAAVLSVDVAVASRASSSTLKAAVLAAVLAPSTDAVTLLSPTVD